ncbi:hypothetical protein ACHAPT_013064 [Fusarium lateritium]
MAVSLTHTINRATIGHPPRGSIKRFWERLERQNWRNLEQLWDMRRQLRSIINCTGPIFTQVDESLRPHTDNPLETWTLDVTDAIDFSRENILPVVEWITFLIARAITRLSSLDSKISLQVEYWRNMTQALGVTRQVTCYNEADGQKLYWGWVLVCEEVTTHWLLENRTLEGLGNIGNRGAEMAKVIRTRDWSYHKNRSSRPGDMGK